MSDHIMTALAEKLGALDAKVRSAHARIDKMEGVIREDLKELKSELRELNAHMNQGKGWAAAIMVLSGAAGGTLVKILSLVQK